MTRWSRSLILATAIATPLCSLAPASAQELGRLFFTPQQRQDLDRRRDTKVVEHEPVVESLVTVNGHVVRSTGKSTTWINGVAQHDTYGGRDPTRVRLEDGSIKVGQTIDRTRGDVRENFGNGEVRVNRPAPERLPNKAAPR